jgi:hypothetical protein
MQYFKTYEQVASEKFCLLFKQLNKVMSIGHTYSEAKQKYIEFRKKYIHTEITPYPAELRTIEEVQAYFGEGGSLKKPEPKYEITEDQIGELLDMDWNRSFFSEDRVREYIEQFMSEFNRMGDTITLHRLVRLEHIDNLNGDKLGNHYVVDRNLLTDSEFLESIGIEEHSGSYYIVSVKVDKKDVNLMTTLAQRMLNSHEEEFFIDDHIKPEIVETERVEI